MPVKHRRTRPAIASPSEHEEQTAFMEWLALAHPQVFALTTAVPHQFTGRSSQMRMRVREGLKKGYPDVLIDYPVVAKNAPVEHFHGLRIEAKRARGVPSDVKPEQRGWINQLNAMGYCAVVAWGADDMIVCTESYLSGRHPKRDDPFARPPK